MDTIEIFYQQMNDQVNQYIDAFNSSIEIQRLLTFYHLYEMALKKIYCEIPFHDIYFHVVMGLDLYVEKNSTQNANGTNTKKNVHPLENDVFCFLLSSFRNIYIRRHGMQ